MIHQQLSGQGPLCFKFQARLVDLRHLQQIRNHQTCFCPSLVITPDRTCVETYVRLLEKLTGIVFLNSALQMRRADAHSLGLALSAVSCCPVPVSYFLGFRVLLLTLRDPSIASFGQAHLANCGCRRVGPLLVLRYGVGVTSQWESGTAGPRFNGWQMLAPREIRSRPPVPQRPQPHFKTSALSTPQLLSPPHHLHSASGNSRSLIVFYQARRRNKLNKHGCRHRSCHWVSALEFNPSFPPPCAMAEIPRQKNSDLVTSRCARY